jgi:hypothetical protein
MIVTDQEQPLVLGDVARSRLTDLTERYHAERARVVSTAMLTSPTGRQDACRYCGRKWTQWVGSKTDGHVQCLVGADFKRLVRAVWNSDPMVTLGTIADALGVTTAVVRAWVVRVISESRSG